jgi:signal transduction histidine kinase/ActR/RegA family two-component response regulator
MMPATITQVMSPDVVCVTADVALLALEELLVEHGLPGITVVDGARRPLGFVTMSDLVRGLHDRDATAGQLMSAIAHRVPASAPAGDAIAALVTASAQPVVVVGDDGVLVGLVTAEAIVRHHAQAERSLPHDQLAEADRLVSLGFLAGGVAHQINNALTSMRLSLGRLTSFELSRRPLTAQHLHRIELLQDVREGVSRIERVIRELKAFSHTEDGPRQPIDVAAVLEIALGLAAHQIRHRARLVCDYGRLPAVRARPAELRQIFLNLLVNAAQAILAGEAHINEIRVTTRTDERGRAVIEIADTGTGIPADVRGRIFEPFFTTRSEAHGLGLGLAVSRDIVAALDGEIALDSVVGRGTTVRVTLPGSDQPAIPVAVPAEPAPRQRSRGDHRRILIVDDDRPVAAAIALELGQHDVVVAESGREALEILHYDRDFDVILCDLMMPEVSGMDVYEALQLIEPSLVGRVVLMTGGAFTARAGEFLASVDAPMLEKPFEPDMLHTVVDALEHRRALAAIPEPTDDDCSDPRARPHGER